MKTLSYLLSISLLLLVSVACNSQEKKTEENSENNQEALIKEKPWQDLSTTAFEASFKANPEAQVLDIRTPDEWATGHLKEAKLVDWFTIFKTESEQWDKDGHYYLYCRSGGRSRQASVWMHENGFKNIYNMLGGMRAWKGEVVVD